MDTTKLSRVGSAATWWGIGLVAVSAIATGCATSQPDRVVEMEPLRFEAERNEAGEIVVHTMDPDLLFKEAAEDYRSGKFASAARRFDRLIEHFPEHPKSNPARFNASLAWMELGEPRRALGHALEYVERAQTEGDSVDGLMQLAQIYRELEDWAPMGQALDRMLGLRLTPPQKLRALALRGLAFHAQGELARAEEFYQDCLALHREHLELPMFHGSADAAMAQYQIGEIYHALFDSIALVLPMERMEQDLDDKSRLFLKAQSAYLKAVRVRNAHWAIRAGFQIGQIYEEFYEDFLGAEHPDDLSDEELAVYFEELRAKIRPLVERAVVVYEQNLLQTERMRLGGTEWADKMRERITTLRELLRQEDQKGQGERGPERPAS